MVATGTITTSDNRYSVSCVKTDRIKNVTIMINSLGKMMVQGEDSSGNVHYIREE